MNLSISIWFISSLSLRLFISSLVDSSINFMADIFSGFANCNLLRLVINVLTNRLIKRAATNELMNKA
jgi:hypothetical protein